MTTLVDIPRVRAGTSATKTNQSLNEIDQERLYLATRAKDVLGYDVLKQMVTGNVKVGVCEGKLTETLLKLDLTILDTVAVVDYQLEELARRNREFILAHIGEWAGRSWGVTVASWQNTELKSYDQPVPEFVLDKAIKIKEALPEVTFIIQHLSDPKADPFLIACHNKEVYYVEAWAEPRFEEKL